MMAVRKIRILPAGTRVVWAEASKAARLVKEGRAEYVDVPAPTSVRGMKGKK